MKKTYPRYRQSTEELLKNLTSRDREILDKFLQLCRMTASEGRIKTKYLRYMLHFRDIIEKPFDSVTKQDAIIFWGLVKGSPYSEHSRIAIRKVVRRFLKWHFRDFDMIEMLKIQSNYLVNRERVNKANLISDQELKAMSHKAVKIRDKCLLILLYETAGRPQEIKDLTWEDINFREREVHLFSKKTQRDRDLPVFQAMNQLMRWKNEWVFEDPQPNDYVFPSRVGERYVRNKPLSVEYINRVIKRLGREAGITRVVYPYLLRHTRLTELQRKGVTGVLFKKFADHAPGSKQEHVYVHMDNTDLKRVMTDKFDEPQELSPPEREQYDAKVARLEAQLQKVSFVLEELQLRLTAIDDRLSVVA